MTTQFMGLELPAVGQSTTYVEDITSNYGLIDEHDHVSTGIQLNQNSISWSDLDMGSSYVDSVQAITFVDISSLSTSENSLFFYLGDAYWADASSNYVKLTQDGSVNISDSYLGFYGNFSSSNASVQYTAASNTYSFDSDNSPQIIFDEFLSSGTSDFYDLEIGVSLNIDSTTKMYSDSIFPGVLPEDNPTFFVDSNGVFQTSQATELSIEDAFLKNVETDYNLVDALYTNSTVTTELEETSFKPFSVFVENSGAVIEWEMLYAETFTSTHYSSGCIMPFKEFLDNVYTTKSSSSDISTPIIYRALIKPSSTVPSGISNLPSVANSKYIQFRVINQNSTTTNLVFSWEYQAVTFTDQNILTDSTNANIQVCPISEALVTSPVVGDYLTCASGFLQLQGYCADLDTDTDFYVLLTLHVAIIT